MTVQIVGVSWYGYIVGTWASVLNSFDSEDKEQRRCNKALQFVRQINEDSMLFVHLSLY